MTAEASQVKGEVIESSRSMPQHFELLSFGGSRNATVAGHLTLSEYSGQTAKDQKRISIRGEWKQSKGGAEVVLTVL